MKDDRVTLSQAEARARRRRSIAIGLVLVALVVIFYVVSIAKMASQVGAAGS